MMKSTNVNVISILPGAQYDGYIWDYWVIVELNNGEIIVLFDSDSLIKDYKIGDNISVVISAVVAEEQIDVNANNLFKFNTIETEMGVIAFENNHIVVYVNLSEPDVQASYNVGSVISFSTLCLKEIAHR